MKIPIIAAAGESEIALKQRMVDKIELMIAEANEQGFGTDEALDALDEVVANAKVIYDEDPDPAADPEVRHA